MKGFSCNACNLEFDDEAVQKAHYRSDWHRYNLKRKVAGVPGVTEGLYNLRQEALAADKKRQEGARLLYKCSLCGKEYATEKAHGQHLRSKAHIGRAAMLEDSSGAGVAVIRPAPTRPVREEAVAGGKEQRMDEEGVSGSSDDDWEEIEGEEASDIVADLREDDSETDDSEAGPSDEAMAEGWDASKCFICDLVPDGTIEGCVEHMHKAHGFFIPDSEFLKDPQGMLSYLGLKVTQGYMCLFCDDRGKRFRSVDAVRKHMISKSHCKLHFGDEDDEAEDDLSEFYDYSPSYMVSSETSLVKVDSPQDAPVSMVNGGLELMVQSANGKSAKTIGSRELFRYYKQRPRPSDHRDGIAVNAVVAKYRSMGLATKSPEQKALLRAGPKNAPSQRLEVFRTKVAMSNNVIRNLPRNCTY